MDIVQLCCLYSSGIILNVVLLCSLTAIFFSIRTIWLLSTDAILKAKLLLLLLGSQPGQLFFITLKKKASFIFVPSFWGLPCFFYQKYIQIFLITNFVVKFDLQLIFYNFLTSIHILWSCVYFLNLKYVTHGGFFFVCIQYSM